MTCPSKKEACASHPDRAGWNGAALCDSEAKVKAWGAWQVAGRGWLPDSLYFEDRAHQICSLIRCEVSEKERYQG